MALPENGERAFEWLSFGIVGEESPQKKQAKVGEFDIWLPVLATSAKLLARAKKRGKPIGKDFFDAYERELKKTA